MSLVARAYTPVERLAWLPVLAPLAAAAEVDRGAFARAVARHAEPLIHATAVACDTTPDRVDALDPSEFLDLLADVLVVNAAALADLKEAHGDR